jgi:hypothetical protein
LCQDVADSGDGGKPGSELEHDEFETRPSRIFTNRTEGGVKHEWGKGEDEVLRCAPTCPASKYEVVSPQSGLHADVERGVEGIVLPYCWHVHFGPNVLLMPILYCLGISRWTVVRGEVAKKGFSCPRRFTSTSRYTYTTVSSGHVRSTFMACGMNSPAVEGRALTTLPMLYHAMLTRHRRHCPEHKPPPHEVPLPLT